MLYTRAMQIYVQYDKYKFLSDIACMLKQHICVWFNVISFDYTNNLNRRTLTFRFSLIPPSSLNINNFYQTKRSNIFNIKKIKFFQTLQYIVILKNINFPMLFHKNIYNWCVYFKKQASLLINHNSRDLLKHEIERSIKREERAISDCIYSSQLKLAHACMQPVVRVNSRIPTFGISTTGLSPARDAWLMRALISLWEKCGIVY